MRNGGLRDIALRLAGVSALGAQAIGCGGTTCPAGSYDFMGRCIAEDVDAGAVGDDGGARVDARVSPDAFVLLDACAPVRGFVDQDLDGHGDPMREELRCAPIGSTGFVAISGDCDDDETTTAPGAEERCDGVDQDCDGAIDEGLQGLIGAPIRLGPETGVDSMLLHAAVVGGSYVVAWNRPDAVVVARFDATGAVLAAPHNVVETDSESFLRVVPIDATHVVVITVLRMSGWKNQGFYATPVTIAPSFEVGTTVVLEVTPFTSNAAIAYDGTDLTTIFDHEVAPVGMVQDASLTSIASGLATPATYDTIRSLHAVDGSLWLLDGALAVHRLTSRTLVEERRVDLAIPSALAGVATLDAHGLSVFVGDESLVGVAHVALADLEAEPVPIARTTWVPTRPLTVAPALAASEAGADLVTGGIDGAELALTYSHIDPAGGAHAEAEVARVTSGRHVSVARLSSRAGAIFYPATDATGGWFWMQRIGCE